MTVCTHLDHVHITELPESVAECEDCLAKVDPWLHLRICLECGKWAVATTRQTATRAPTLAAAAIR